MARRVLWLGVRILFTTILKPKMRCNRYFWRHELAGIGFERRARRVARAALAWPVLWPAVVAFFYAAHLYRRRSGGQRAHSDIRFRSCPDPPGLLDLHPHWQLWCGAVDVRSRRVENSVRKATRATSGAAGR